MQFAVYTNESQAFTSIAQHMKEGYRLMYMYCALAPLSGRKPLPRPNSYFHHALHSSCGCDRLLRFTNAMCLNSQGKEPGYEDCLIQHLSVFLQQWWQDSSPVRAAKVALWCRWCNGVIIKRSRSPQQDWVYISLQLYNCHFSPVCYLGHVTTLSLLWTRQVTDDRIDRVWDTYMYRVLIDRYMLCLLGAVWLVGRDVYIWASLTGNLPW